MDLIDDTLCACFECIGTCFENVIVFCGEFFLEVLTDSSGMSGETREEDRESVRSRLNPP
jgi:hypothetical protein